MTLPVDRSRVAIMADGTAVTLPGKAEGKDITELKRDCLILATKEQDMAFVLGDKEGPLFCSKAGDFTPEDGWDIWFIEWPIQVSG